MATVTAADEALSSCSQNAAYSATIMAAQIRSAKAQVESGNPAMVMVQETPCTSVTAPGAARPKRGAGGYLPLLGVASLIAVVRTFSQITVAGAGISAGSNRAPWLASNLRTSAASRRPPRARHAAAPPAAWPVAKAVPITRNEAPAWRSPSAVRPAANRFGVSTLLRQPSGMSYVPPSGG